MVLASKSKLNRISNFKWIAISWHLRKQVGVIACPMYQRLLRFPANSEDKYKDKIKKKLMKIGHRIYCKNTS